MTNFDKIKEMGVDELAKAISRGISSDPCDYCKYAEKCDAHYYCKYNKIATDVEIIKDWLNDEYD